MKRGAALALAVLLAGVFLADAASAKKKKFWRRYDATIICDIADTRVVLHNGQKWDITVIVRLTDHGGDTQQTLIVPAESNATFDCASLGVTTTAVLSFEGPAPVHASASYLSPSGSLDVEPLVAIPMSGFRLPRDDSDTGDSDSASGDPTPSS